MALVMKTADVAAFLSNKIALTDGVTTNFAVNGVTHLDAVTYPAQGEFAEGAVLGMIQKPFIDFAISCGGAGAMTADMITAKYAGIPANLAEAIAADFAKAYGNYVIIPAAMTLMITGVPVTSVFNIMIPEPPVDPETEPKM